MNQLDVINRMLGTMGEAPVESLTEDHDFIPAGLARLEGTNKAVQGRAWWFNTEAVTLDPDEDGHLILPADVIGIQSRSRRLSFRRGRIYDLSSSTDVFTSSVDLQIIRLVPFEDLEQVAKDYIAIVAVEQFQREYDGDSTKTRELLKEVKTAFDYFHAAHTLAVNFNAIYTNPRRRRMHAVTRRLRMRT